MNLDSTTWESLLHGQDGVITRTQALASGWTSRAIEHRLGRTWQRLLPGVYLTATGTPSRSQLVWAGLLHGGPDAALTSWTGLEQWGLRHDPRADVHVAVPHDRRRVDLDFLVGNGAVVLHRSTRPLERRRTVPTLTVERCVIDAGLGMTALHEVRALVSGAVQAGRTTPERLFAELDAAPQRGSGPLRTALSEVTEGARSAPEAVLVASLRTITLPPYRLNADVHAVDGRWLARGDVVLAELKLIVEIDGKRWHLSSESWVADLERHTRLEAEGWTVLRYPASRVLAAADEVAAEIAAVAWRLAAQTRS